MSNPNDNLIATLQKEIQKQTAQLGPKPKFVPNGDTVIKWNNQQYNLLVMTEDELTEYLVWATLRHETLDVLVRKYPSIGFEEKFTKSVETYNDVVARIEILVYNAAKKKLDAKSAQLDKLLSTEAATALELQRIADSL
jgi:hypothetical protein